MGSRPWFWLLLLCLPAYGQAPTRVVSTIANLADLYPGLTQPHVLVQGFYNSGDWGAPKAFRWDSTNALSTNAIRRATKNSVGRWIHDWDGDVRAFGAKGDGVTDNTAALQEANAYSFATKIPMRLGVGIYNTTETIALNERMSLLGEIGYYSTSVGSTIQMTSSNKPIVTIAGLACRIKDVGLVYSNWQLPANTNSACLEFLSTAIVFEAENVSMRKGAYGILARGNVSNFSIRDLHVNGFSRSGVRIDGGGTVSAWDNVYIQNILDGPSGTVDTVSITNVVRSSGTNLTFTCTSLPTYVNTNQFLYVSDLSPSVYNGQFVVKTISGTTFTADMISDPGVDPSDVSGSAYLPAKESVEAPMILGYGMYTIRGLDIEHCIHPALGSLVARGQMNQIEDVHFEQLYGTATDTGVHSWIKSYAKTLNVGSVSIVNCGLMPGTTNYVISVSPYTTVYAQPWIAAVSVRDIASTGATFDFVENEFGGDAAEPVFGNWNVSDTKRANATPVWYTATLQSPLAAVHDLRSAVGGAYEYGLRYIVTNNQSTTAVMSAFSTDVRNIGSRGASTFLLQATAEAVNPILRLDARGKLAITETESVESQFGTLTTNKSAFTLNHGAATDSRMTMYGNGIQIVSNTIPSGKKPMLLNTVYGGNVAIGNGTAGEGLELGQGGPRITRRAGSPEGAISAPVGSICINTSGGAGTILYEKATGTGSTGWVLLNRFAEQETLAPVSATNFTVNFSTTFAGLIQMTNSAHLLATNAVAGKTYKLLLVNESGSDQSLTLQPGWFRAGPLITQAVTNGTAFWLDLRAYGTNNESNIVARGEAGVR